MTMPLTDGGFIKMALPFVEDSAKSFVGFLSQYETAPKYPSSRRRVSPYVSLKNTNTKITNKNSYLHSQFKCLCTTKY